MNDKKIVITGLSCISALGLDLNTNWDNMLNGKSGVNKITLFDPKDLMTQIAAQVPKDFELLSEEKIKKRTLTQMTRATKMCYLCAADAIEMSSINLDLYDKTRCSVILGVVNTGKLDNDPKNKIIKGMNNAMSAWLSIKYKFEGPNYTIATACSSSAYAIASGYDLIKNNLADLVIVGGADSTINPEEILGFNELYALSTNNKNPQKASCPFSKDRDGFVIGEGAGILILESEESAKKRDVNIYAELCGYSLTTECYNIMAPMENGEGMAKTMEMALKKTNLTINDIDYINAHGTSTELNDKFETQAIKKVFGDQAYKIPVSSTKSMIGHTIGAAGAIESIVTVLSVYHDIITPTINYDNKDPELDLDYVPNKSKAHNINFAISNSFAFGGHNASLIFKKYKN
ncbi:MAG: beta-ketoacyl-[acyl-carrier-protein] synthase family protein [Spirochaetes bacterium]|nr:beta-ketoacyl-[acyl-carrier-protein] synthase family protein [Spirochaetota bacterium]